MLTDKQTDTQTDVDENVTSLAGVMKQWLSDLDGKRKR